MVLLVLLTVMKGMNLSNNISVDWFANLLSSIYLLILIIVLLGLFVKFMKIILQVTILVGPRFVQLALF
ncbi:hypothetical protein BH11PSE12_BH11PSE12_27180 [soil metagenome]